MYIYTNDYIIVHYVVLYTVVMWLDTAIGESVSLG